jgi:hypothetical protein
VEIVFGSKEFDTLPIETIDVDPPNFCPIGSRLSYIVLNFDNVVQGRGYRALRSGIVDDGHSGGDIETFNIDGTIIQARFGGHAARIRQGAFSTAKLVHGQTLGH